MKGKALAAALMVCASQTVWTGSAPASRLQPPAVRANPPIQTFALEGRQGIPGDLWAVPKRKPYFVQAGQFSRLMRALLLAAAIEQRYPDAFVSAQHFSRTRLYQVRIGPFDDRADAQDAADWLESLGHDAMILRLGPFAADQAALDAERPRIAFRIDP